MRTADFTLLGALSYEELRRIHSSSNRLLNSAGWRGNWPADFESSIKKRDQAEEDIAPDQFFQKLYHLEDLGVFHLDTQWSDNIPLRLDLFFHDSIQPSFQIRASCEISHSIVDSPFDCWEELHDLRRSVCSLVDQLDLNPTMDTITLDDARGISQSGSRIKKLRRALLQLMQNETCALETASLIDGQAFVIRSIGDGRDQFLILPLTNLGELAVSQLYYLAIAKSKIKVLLTHLKESYQVGLSALKPEINSYMTPQNINEAELKRLLALRNRIANHTTRFRVLKNHVDLVIGFLDFNVKALSTGLDEKSLLHTHPCTMAAERESLQLYYLGPLKTVTMRTGELIKEASSIASTISEIMMLRVNLKSQKYLERLQAAALVFAVLSALLVFKTEIGSAIYSLYQQLLIWGQTIKR